MSSFNINQLLPIFLDKTGKPLNGQVWFGVINQNPINNPISVYYDSALTILAPNPLQISNGKIVRNGVPAQIYVSSAFSAVVKDSSGVFIEQVDNSDANLDALVQLAGNNGMSLIGYKSSLANSVATTLKSIVESGNDYLHRVYGAVGDGVTDDTLAFNRCAAAGYPIVGRIGKTYKTTDTLILRNVWVNLEGCTISCAHGNVGVQGGGHALTRPNPFQYYSDIVRASGQPTTQPQLEIRGAKGTLISTYGVDWVRLYVEEVVDSGQSYSIAYSTFHFNGCKELHLTSSATAPGWINENDFYLNDYKKVHILGTSTNSFNHNRFHGGTWEATTVDPIVEIKMDYAANNIFYNVRAEANAGVTGMSHQIYFGITTDAFCFNNEIQITRVSSEYNGFPDGLPPYIQINRNNSELGNLVWCPAAMRYRKHLVAHTTISDTQFYPNDVGSGPMSVYRNRQPHTKYIRASAAYWTLCMSDYIFVDTDDIFFFSYNSADNATCRYKCKIEFYNNKMVPLTPLDTSWIKSPSISTITGNGLISSDALSGQYVRITKEGTAAGVAYVRVSVIHPSTTSYAIATRVQVQMLSTSRSINATTPFIYPMMSTGIPTQSVARYGAVVRNNTTGVAYTNIRDVRTTVSTTVSSGTSLVVADATYMVAGDMCAVCLDNDSMLHTTIVSIASNTLTLAAAIPSTITAGAVVVVNRWI